MNRDGEFEIFLMAAPGLEAALYAEVLGKRYKAAKPVPGGVMVRGSWKEVWRANLELRGAGRVLARLWTFRAPRLDDLARLARGLPWGKVLRPDQPVRVEATCRSSRIYHSGAAEERVANAIRDKLGAPIQDAAGVCIRVRIENDVCSIAVDTSGELLHKRGHKEAVNAAPMRETMAALLLGDCGFTGDEPVFDPMCGSGTFVIEAAEMAARLMPGRSRTFAFEQLSTYDGEAWQRLRAAAVEKQRIPEFQFHGCDRDAGAVRMSRANAERAGVSAWTSFEQRSVEEAEPPQGPPGLVIANPPYGNRLGDQKQVRQLYREFGLAMRQRFAGWRVAIVTNDPSLARATDLPFGPASPPINHGGLRVSLFKTEALA